MLRSLTYLLLTILSLSGHIHCADNDTKANEEVARANEMNDGWLARDIKLTEPHSVLMWQSGSPHRKFFYLTWDGKKNYCMVTQVSTESSNGASKTCQFKFKRNEYVTKIWRLELPDEDNEIGIAYTTHLMDSNTYIIRGVDFSTCQSYGAPEANQTDSSSTETPTEEEDAKEVKIIKATEHDTPLSSASLNIYSNAHGMYAHCKVNQERTQVACTQYDKDNKVLIDNVKYDLPTHWKADWFAAHNSKAGALLLYFSDCPNGMCKDYGLVRLTANGWDGKRFVQDEMNLKCSDKSRLTVDVTDRDDEWVCMHAVCPEVNKPETLLQYRRQCLQGDVVA